MDSVIYFIKSVLSNEIAVNGFPLIYKGEMSHQMMRSFALMANRKLQNMNVATAVRKKVFHIMIECLQNITKHSDDFDEQEQQVGNGLFMVGHDREAFYVITGNIVKPHNVPPLEERIVKLNKASGSDLKRMFLQQMSVGELTDKGGAGLGLIDIRRKSGRNLYYHFVPHSDDAYFFILAVVIPHTSTKNDEDSDPEHP
ncbi:MAG: SiaB family protein kinase [Bacteroidales bacterium]|nr:SiaB family protein kinase [Bacteroidales bacterium]